MSDFENPLSLCALLSLCCAVSAEIGRYSQGIERWSGNFIVFRKVSTISEKLISKPAQVREDGMELALTGCASGSSFVHKDSSSTTYATKRSRVKQPQKAMSVFQGREVLESCISLQFYSL